MHSILHPIRQTTKCLVEFSILHHLMQNTIYQSWGLAKRINGLRLRVRCGII